jgi:hypothetical protein
MPDRLVRFAERWVGFFRSGALSAGVVYLHFRSSEEPQADSEDGRCFDQRRSNLRSCCVPTKLLRYADLPMYQHCRTGGLAESQ